MKVCKKCGKSIRDNDSVCIHCGENYSLSDNYSVLNKGACKNNYKFNNKLDESINDKSIVEVEQVEYNIKGLIKSEIIEKYGDFSGRISLEDFWTLFLILIGMNFTLYLIPDFTPIAISFSIIITIPIIGLHIRRLHDINKSGFWLFILMIPFFGIIALIIMEMKQGDKFKNDYGYPSERR